MGWILSLQQVYSNRVKSYFYNFIPIVTCVIESVTIFYFDLAVSPNGLCWVHDYDLRSVIPEYCMLVYLLIAGVKM